MLAVKFSKSLVSNSLYKIRSTKNQTNLTAKERKLNVKGAFQVRKSHRIAQKRVLLVDDVYTTGSTVNECARMLLKHGSVSVEVLTVARG